MKQVIGFNICRWLLPVLLLTGTGCKKFLEETSPELAIPSSINQYEELLYGGGYPIRSSDNYTNLEVMSDNVEFRYVQKPQETWRMDNYRYRSLYLWQRDPEGIEANIFSDFWQKIYSAIMICNTVVEGMEKYKPQVHETEQARKTLLGQALLLRAHHYLTLVNLFGEPYRAGKELPLGVVIKLTAGAEQTAFKRSSVTAVYQQVQRDINDALKLIDKASPNNWEFNYRAGLILGTRAALHREDWDEVIRLGEEYLKAWPDLVYASQSFPDGSFLALNNPEIAHLYGTSNITLLVSAENPTGYIISEELLNLYNKGLSGTEKDARRDWFFLSTPTITYPYVKKQATNQLKGSTYRTAEVYLNLAEAYSRKGADEKAMELLNKFRSNRIRNYRDRTLTDLNNQPLLGFIEEERRREFCFEDNMRWLDIRRFNRQVIHRYKTAEGNYRVTLGAGDAAYILPIPKEELIRSPQLSNAARPDRQPEREQSLPNNNQTQP